MVPSVVVAEKLGATSPSRNAIMVLSSFCPTFLILLTSCDPRGPHSILTHSVIKVFSRLPKDKLVALHCKSGGRSGPATESLQSQGYVSVGLPMSGCVGILPVNGFGEDAGCLG